MVAEGEDRRLDAVLQGEFGEDAADVGLDGLLGLVGVFWGAPLVTREVEARTLPLAWNRTVTRTRWMAVKLGVADLLTVATAGLLSLMLTWWSSPMDTALNMGTMSRLNLTRLGPILFDSRDITPVGYAAFAFALGVTAGVLIRRTLPALAGFAAVQVAWPVWIRQHLIAPVHAVVALDPGNVFQIKTINNNLIISAMPNFEQQAPGCCLARSSTGPVTGPRSRPPRSASATTSPRARPGSADCTCGRSSATSPPAACGASSGPRPRSSLSSRLRWPGCAPGGSAGGSPDRPRIWNPLLVSCSKDRSYSPGPPAPATPEVQVMAAESNVIAGPVRRPRNPSAHVPGSIHDDATATALGFRGGTVAGSIHMDQFPPLLLEAFGQGWFETGSLSLYFRYATTDGEPVQAFAECPTAGGQDAQVRAWMTTEDGDLVAEGTASAGRPQAPSALRGRDLRPVDPGRLRMLRALRPGDLIGDLPVAVNAGRQLSLIAGGTMTEPLPWYAGASPWGGPVASPSAVVDLLYTDLLAGLRRSMGPWVGLFGAIEIRFGAGPVYLHGSYRVSGEVTALSETPKTEVLWFDSRALGEDGVLVAEMRMMLRQMKQASPLYQDQAASP